MAQGNSAFHAGEEDMRGSLGRGNTRIREAGEDKE